MAGQPVLVDQDESEYTFVIDTQGVLARLVPASSIGLYNDVTLLGHDKGWEILVTESDGTTPFPLAGIGISFYAKAYPTSTIFLWTKTTVTKPGDVMTPAAGVIDVWARVGDTALLQVGTVIFLYVDILDTLGNPINVATWTTTISM
jgi:hypothetical protein